MESSKNNPPTYIASFFQELSTSAVGATTEASYGHEPKQRPSPHCATPSAIELIHQSIINFQHDESKPHALAVYFNFFDTYKFTGSDSTSFVDLLDIMLHYEETASTLVAKQRDHYIHSVNVFLLGLAIFSQNQPLRQCFPYGHHEFLYRWGITSLFHDIGYPLEIIDKQIDGYLNFVTTAATPPPTAPVPPHITAYIGHHDFPAFDTIPDLGNFPAFAAEYCKSEGLSPEEATHPTILMAKTISRNLGLDYNMLRQKLSTYVSDMEKHGFIDHGFYSAEIILLWYGLHAQQSALAPSDFFQVFPSIASAILLHNYYGHTLQKPPFSLSSLSPSKDPLAFLLMLCDELQDWNRPAYGYVDKTKHSSEFSHLSITNDSLKLTYISKDHLLGDDYERDKERTISTRLDIPAVFARGIILDTINIKDISFAPTTTLVSRPTLPQLESMAKKIHSDYVTLQRRTTKADLPNLRDWDDLPPDLQYSNIDQARHIAEKLRLIGCSIIPLPEHTAPPSPILHSLRPEEVEYLSIIEHDRWVAERQQSGWTFGPEKNTAQKTSPYLVPWDALTEEVKDLDRDAVKNIIPLLASVHLAVTRT